MGETEPRSEVLPGDRLGDTCGPAPGPVTQRSPQQEPGPGLRQGPAPPPGNRAPPSRGPGLARAPGAPLARSQAPPPRNPTRPSHPRTLPTGAGHERPTGPGHTGIPPLHGEAGSDPAAPGNRPTTAPSPLTPDRLLHAAAWDRPLPPSAGLKPRPSDWQGPPPIATRERTGNPPPQASQPIQPSGSPSASQWVWCFRSVTLPGPPQWLPNSAAPRGLTRGAASGAGLPSGTSPSLLLQL